MGHACRWRERTERRKEEEENWMRNDNREGLEM